MDHKYDVLDYLFDLRGFTIIKNAVAPDLLDRLNQTLDTYLDMKYLDWRGNVQRFDNNGNAGIELQNIVEGGQPFEELIDHPAWRERLQRYCGEQGTYVEGLFIDECFASIRRTGGYFPFHTGGEDGVMRGQYRFVNGYFRCGQVNMILALNDIGPGDGGTMVIPGSHKANLIHPNVTAGWDEKQKIDDIPGAIEVHLQRGDALLFVDAISHGASTRTNPGERRVVIFRYGPKWGSTRYGYRYSPELLARLTPERRQILDPVPSRLPPAA